VGEGAKRVTTAGRSDIDIQRLESDAGAITPAAAQGRLRGNPQAALAQGFQRFGPWLKDQLLSQIERWVLWLPVAFGLGCASYLSMPREPLLWPLLMVGAASLSVLVGANRYRPALFIPCALLLALSAGMLTAKLRTIQVAAPIISQGASTPRTVEGYVIDVLSPGASGGRIMVAPVYVEGLEPSQTPLRLRVTVQDIMATPPGSAIRLRAILNAPPSPASPGAYDFARRAYYDGIGGSGFALGAPRQILLDPPPFRLRAILTVNAMRWRVSRYLIGVMGDADGAVAAAMVSGHEAWLQPKQVDDMRAAGLAHILSISGLHMAIVGGFAFFAIRLLIAAVPTLALRVNGKKLAAGVGLLAVLLYLGLSGAPAPAVRAAITASLAFLAILLDRRALTLHGLAIAALIVLMIEPEAITDPGFQMSFAATAALVALAESWIRPAREINTPWFIRMVQVVTTGLVASLVVSVVAGLATGPFAIQHFNRVATYGLLANMITEPLTGFVIMPGLALGAVLAPLGLGAPILVASGWGISALSALSAWFAALPAAMITIPSAPALALPVAFLGLLWICLWRGRLRWLGVPAALAVSLWPRPPMPDVWIAADGANGAYRQDAQAVLVQTDAKRFGADLWARRRGLTVDETPRFICERKVCRSPQDAPVAVSLWQGRKAPDLAQWQSLCARTEVVIVRADAAVPRICEAKLVFTARDLDKSGSIELWRSPQGWRWLEAERLRGHRPWTAQW
jgi:competence protein ComEC